jgi:site-specific DNA-methyltransferase (adenine-specific)
VGSPEWHSYRYGNVLKDTRITDGDHPHQKPERLLQALVETCTPADGVVLDTFMGSGSTGVACAGLGRRFIGIEIEQKYFDIAHERISAAYAQQRLFA